MVQKTHELCSLLMGNPPTLWNLWRSFFSLYNGTKQPLRYLFAFSSPLLHNTGHLLIRRGANILTAHHSYTSSFRLYWLCAVLSQNSFVNILLRSTVTALINNGEDSGAFYIVLNLNPIISGVFLSLLLTFSLLELMD